MTLPVVLALGFLLGIRHATDPDHVVAISTIVARTRSIRRAALLGASWGAGHTATVVVVGTTMIAFGLVVPARLGLALELGVGIMLVVLGASNLRTWRARSDEAIDEPHDHPRAGLLPSLGIGVVHGLAGSAAVTLLVLASIRSAPLALLYLFVFGAGTILGMVLLTVALAFPMTLTVRGVAFFRTHVVAVTGLASVCVGLLVAYEVIAGGGLFADVPRWDPH